MAKISSPQRHSRHLAAGGQLDFSATASLLLLLPSLELEPLELEARRPSEVLLLITALKVQGAIGAGTDAGACVTGATAQLLLRLVTLLVNRPLFPSTTR